MKSKILIDVGGVNWKLLRKQKVTLIKLLNRKDVNLKQKDHIDGVIALVDHIQDQAADQLGE